MRATIVATALCLSIAGAAAVADADVTARKVINIPAQKLGPALRAFSKERSIHVIFVSEDVNALNTRGAAGELTSEEALKQLLTGTGLTYRYLDDKTVTIIPKTSTPEQLSTGVRGMLSDVLPSAEVGGGSLQLMLAQNAAADGDDLAGGKQTKKVQKKDDVEEMVVQGERDRPAPFTTANVDLTRTEDDILPFTVFTSKDIALSGATNLDQFLRQRLPQNFAATIPEETNETLTNAAGGHNQVRMRGWGAEETVFLVNGRPLQSRYPNPQGEISTGSMITSNFRGIPLGSIERVEILPAAGGTIYGAGATAGVINIITRQDFRGGQMGASFDSPADVDAPKYSADMSYGLPVGSKTSLRFSAGYRTADAMHVRDRSAITVERWRRLIQERAPSRLSADIGATPNINLGGNPVQYTSVPDGYAGGGGLSVFDARRGILSLGLAEGSSFASYSRDANMGNDTRSTQMSFGVDRKLGGNWRLSAEYTYSKDDMLGEGFYQSWSALSVRPSPYSPFATNVSVYFDDPRFNHPDLPPSTNETWSNQFTTTLRGTVGGWSTIADLSYTHDKTAFVYSRIYSPVGGWQNALETGRYNPFVDMRTVAPAAPDFYQALVVNRNAVMTGIESYQSSFKTSGAIFHLPAGPVNLTAGASWARQDRNKVDWVIDFYNIATGSPQPAAPDQNYQIPDLNPHRLFASDTYAVYGETTVPLLSPQQSIPLVEKLEMFVSGRLSRQIRTGVKSTLAGTVNGNRVYSTVPMDYGTRPYLWAAGFRYDVIEGFGLRASRSIGFRPPLFAYITPPDPALPSSQPVNVIDRGRGNQTISLAYNQRISGGNPDLKPESNTATSIGMIFQPTWWRNARVSVDYSENVRDDAITSIGLQTVIDLESELPGRVQRAAPDGHPSGLGPITHVDGTMINFNQLISKSVDFSIEQQFDSVLGGNLMLTVLASKNISFSRQVSSNTPAVEQIRNRTNTDFAQQLKWNGNAQLRWEGRQWTMGWSTRYYDQVLTNTADFVAQGADHAPKAFEHDAFASYRVMPAENTRGLSGILSDMTVSFGVKNVFDREPRFWAATAGRGYLSMDSIMGRSVWLQVRKGF